MMSNDLFMFKIEEYEFFVLQVSQESNRLLLIIF